MKKAVLLSVDTPLIKDCPVYGGGLRIGMLAELLEERGYRVIYANPIDGREKISRGRIDLRYFQPGEIDSFLLKCKPDLLLFEQWYLATFLGLDHLPVIIDLHGPLILENFYRGIGSVYLNASSKIQALAKADCLLVPNQRQENYYYGWDVLAGSKLKEMRIFQVPLFLGDSFPHKRNPGLTIEYIYAGNLWPWIDSRRELSIVADEVETSEKASLSLYLGDPLGRCSDILRIGEKKNVKLNGMVAHDLLLKRYASATIAIDLYRKNLERYLASSTRTIEYLWSGLPVITYSYSDIAEEIRRYDAGWAIERISELKPLLVKIGQGGFDLLKMSGNARKLVDERYNRKGISTELIEYLKCPKKIAHQENFAEVFTRQFRSLEREGEKKIQLLDRSIRKEYDQLLRNKDALLVGQEQRLDRAVEESERLRLNREQDREEYRKKIEVLKVQATEERDLGERRYERLLVEKDRLSRMVEQLRGKHNDDIETLKTEQAKKIEKEEERFRELLEEKNRLSRELEGAREKHNDEIKELKKEEAKKLDQETKRYAELLEEKNRLSRELEGAREKHNDEIKELKKEESKKLDQETKRHKELLDEKNRLSRELEGAREKHNDEIKELKKEEAKKLDQETKRHKELLEEKNRLSHELEGAREKHNDEIKEIKKIEGVKQDKAERHYERIIEEKNRLSREFEAERLKADKRYEILFEEKNRLTRELETIRDKHNDQIDEMKNLEAREQETAELRYQELLGEKNRLARKIEEVHEDYNRRIEHIVAAHSEELTRNIDRFDQVVAEKQAIGRSFADFTTRHNEEVAGLVKEQEDLQAKVRENYIEINRMNEYKRDIGETLTTKNQLIDILRDEIGQLEQRRSSGQKEMEDGLRAIVVDLEARMNAAETDNRRRIAELVETIRLQGSDPDKEKLSPRRITTLLGKVERKITTRK